MICELLFSPDVDDADEDEEEDDDDDGPLDGYDDELPPARLFWSIMG